MYTVIATTAEYGIDVREFSRANLAFDCLAMLHARCGTRRVALYQDNHLIIAYQG